MLSNDFNYFDQSKALELVLILNDFIDRQVDGIEDIETMLYNKFGKIIKLRLQNVETPDEGPIYHYVSEINRYPISIYVADWCGSQLIVAVNSGMQTTYINEKMKNTIKGAVN